MNELLASVDLGGTNIAIALGHSDGQVLVSSSLPTQSHLGPAAILDRLSAHLQSLLPPGQKLNAVGMGVPGLLNADRRRTLFLPNLATQWREVPVCDLLESKLACPVYLLNDARLAALGELVHGHGRTLRDFVFFTLGTGIGGGIVLDGRLRLGPLGAAGELGHLTILPDGPLCGCGARGCLETLSSATAVARAGAALLSSGQAPHLASLADHDPARVNPELMLRSSDPAVHAAIETAAVYLGIGIAQVVHTLHPQAIVLGGGLAQMGETLFAPARAEMLRRVNMFSASDIPFLTSQTGSNAALLGGFALASGAVR